MAEGITARLKDITNGVAKLDLEAKAAAKDVAAVNTKLKFDPTNVNLVVERFDLLQKELDANNKKLNALKNAQKKLAAEREKEKGDTEQSKKNIAEIAKLEATCADLVKKAEANQARINQLLSQTNKNSQIVNTVTQQINQKYDVWLRATEKLANATKKLYNNLKQTVIEASETGVQLSSMAKRYNTTAEDIQTWDRALQLATGQSELFTQSLSVMVKGMAQIAAGRGVAFKKALKNIGVAYNDIKDLSATGQFEAIIEGLSQVENYSTRAAAAQQLFGESGQYIASVLEDGGAALDGYKEKAESFGIIANSDAEALAQMNIMIEQARSKMTEAKAVLAAALLPALEILVTIIENYVAPAIKTLSKGFEALGKVGQGFILVLGIVIITLPKFIRMLAYSRIAFMSFQAGARGATVAVTGLNAALGAVGIILMAISAAIVLVTSLMQKATEETNKATDALQNYSDVAEQMGLISRDAQINAEETSTSMTTRTVDISVEITGKGDTAISDAAAVTVAQLTAEQINRQLGELVK